MRNRLIQPTTRRRGAVLVLVIVLLVLLAMMGVAYMASARTDRAASAQNIVNTQIDLLLDGARSIATAAISGDVIPARDTYRPVADTAYEHLDTIVGTYDSFLAARAPTLLSDIAWPTGAPDLGPGLVEVSGGGQFGLHDAGGTPVILTAPDGSPLSGDAILWPALSRPGQVSFVNPADGAIQQVRQFSGGALRQGAAMNQGADLPNIVARHPAFPTEVRVGGVAMPGLRVYGPDGQPRDVLAADSDGDGIADALLFDLNFTQNGIKYFAAVRIVDNNSAINLSTAGGREHPWDLFPGNIDLESLLHPNDDINVLVRHLAGGHMPILTEMVRDDRQPVPARYRTLADFLWMRNGRRLDNPGYVQGAEPLSGPLPPTDTTAVARRFVLSDQPDLATVDGLLPESLRATAASATTPRLVPYEPAAARDWFQAFFDPYLTGNAIASIRGLVVTRNPVSNATIVKSEWDRDQAPKQYSNLALPDTSDADPGNDNLQVMPEYDPIGVKADVNTSDFATLWQAYWSVMVGNTASAGLTSEPGPDIYSPSAAPGPTAAGKMFRDVDRVDRSAYTPSEEDTPAQQAAKKNAQIGVTVPGMVLLRSALAAVNTIDMRDLDDDVTVFEFEQIAGAQGGNRRFRVYGFERQPFLTECVAYKDFEWDEETLDDGSIRRFVVSYKTVVAIELFNPYDRPLDLRDYALATIDRANIWPRELAPVMMEAEWNTAVGAALGAGAGQPILLAPKQRLVLYNSRDEAGDDIPAAATLIGTLPAGTVHVDVEGLGMAVGKELVILRPRKVGQLQADELLAPARVGLSNRVPVDQIDLTGLIPPSGVFSEANGQFVNNFPSWYHYARANDAAGTSWQWVFPGRYSAYPATDGSGNARTEPRTGWTGIDLRYEGMKEFPGENPPTHGLGAEDVGTAALKFIIPLGLTNSPGPATLDSTPLAPGKAPAYPFGGFARNGDILQVPYIGSYRIQYMGGDNPLNPGEALDPNQPGYFAELNSISMDSAYADDMNPANDALEQVGRFIPLYAPGGAVDNPATHDRNEADPDYGWAATLLDYLTVQAPHADFLPQMSKEAYWSMLDRLGHKPAGMTPQQEEAWQNANLPEPISNFYVDPAYANHPIEKLIGVEGLVNLNTAPWQVIARLPLLPQNTPDWQDRQNALAKAIVRYRNTHGPFANLFELNFIPAYNDAALVSPAFMDAMGPWNSTAFTLEHGDVTFDPAAGRTLPPGQFMDRYLMMNRISNHVTLRSDSFTVYVLVQGWRDAQTPSARLAAERRAAYVIDRTRLMRDGQGIIIRNIPQD